MKVLSVCNHPGGVNALLPVIDALIKSKHSVSVITRKRNCAVFQDYRLKTKYVEGPVSLDFSLEVFNTIKPDLLLTGTSEPGDPEDEDVGRIESIFVNAAKKIFFKHNYS